MIVSRIAMFAIVWSLAAIAAGAATAQSGGLDRLPDLSPGRKLPTPESFPTDEGTAASRPFAEEAGASPEDHGTANRFAAEAAAKRAAAERRPSASERRFTAVTVFACAALLGLAALARTMLRARGRAR